MTLFKELSSLKRILIQILIFASCILYQYEPYMASKTVAYICLSFFIFVFIICCSIYKALYFNLHNIKILSLFFLSILILTIFVSICMSVHRDNLNFLMFVLISIFVNFKQKQKIKSNAS